MANKFECKNRMCSPESCYLLNNLNQQAKAGGWDTAENAKNRSTNRQLGPYRHKGDVEEAAKSTLGFMEKWHCSEPDQVKKAVTASKNPRFLV